LIEIPLLLINGRIIDPISGRDEVANLLVVGGKCRIVAGDQKVPEQAKTIDLKGMWVMPGLIDMHVHLREPGEEYKETIISGANAAVAGGFTAVACMPNTQPVIDNELAVAQILMKAQKAVARIYPVGAISKDSLGEALSEFGEMKEAGAVAFSDDGLPVNNSQLMRRALEYASNYGITIISHSEEASLSRNGVMNEGSYSTRLGLRGIPRVAEEIAVYRDIALADYTGCPLHLAHVSTRESVSLIRRAKKNGSPVTAETAPHYFSLTEEDVGQYNTYAKMNPPLRTKDDVEAIKEGLRDGTFDVIATDHAPHSDIEKAQEFDLAANGIIGLETAVSLTLNLVREDIISPTRMVELFSVNPAKILGIEGGSLADGARADITVIDPERKYTYTRDKVVSKSKNSPFLDWELKGKAVLTIVDGAVVFDDL
jgi:dihydroorotase